MLENSKSLLKSLKLDKNLTLSQALEKKYTIMRECGIASSNKSINQLNVKSEPYYLTDLTIDESEINKHELNIDQKNVTILNDEHEFAVPNAVPPQTITCNKNHLNRTSSLKNETTIDAHELNVDEKNFSLLNTVTTNNTSKSNLTLEASTAINPLELNLDEKHSLLINSVQNRIASFSRNIPGLAEASLSQSNLSTNETINPLELNVDSKSVTLLNMSSVANQSSFLVNESSLNSNELNADSRLVNMSNSRLLVNESNFSSGSTTIDALERNIDDKNITLINASQSISHQNQSKITENQSTLHTNESQNSSGL